MAEFDPDTLLTERPPAATMRVRPQRKEEEDDKSSTNVSPTMRQILDHIAGGESGGRYDVLYGGRTFDTSGGHPRIAVPIKEGPNAGKTSSAAGRYQFIGSTWDNVAQKTGRHDMSKESQDINAAQLARDTYRKQTGRDIEADWSAGSANLRIGIDRALGAEWEAFTKPGPRVDKLGADGKPRYRFSDYALKEHDARSNTDVVYMTPGQYLDLSPELEGKPFESPSGRALKKSFDRGDEIESVPSLDVNIDGDKATVTDQDGRHRALLAKQNDVMAIPVAIRKTGEGEPSEIVGMSGARMAHNFPKASDVHQQAQEQPTEPIPLQAKPERSFLGRVADAIIPGAAAAEANPFAEFTPPTGATPAPAAGAAPPSSNPFAEFVPPSDAGGAQKQESSTLGQIGDVVGAVGRGLAPYAAGAATGAAIGAPFGGVGAIPGALAGAGAVGWTQMASGLAGLKTPSDMTNAALTSMGVPEPGPAGRIVEQAVGGAANALTGAAAAGQLVKAAAPAMTQIGAAVGSGAMNLLGRVIQTPLGKAVVNLMAEKPGLQAASGALGGAAAQGMAETGAPGWAQELAGLVGALVPAAKNAIAPNAWRVNASDAAKKAIEAGFALPPAEATEGHIGQMNLSNTAAAESGKIKTGQMASAVNQPRVNVKVQQELGVPVGTPLTPTVLEGVRAREGQVYREVERAVPEVTLGLDPQFRSDVAALGKRSESTEKLFPSTKEPPEVPTLRAELLKHASAPTKDVMNYLADLRMRANQNINNRQGDAMQMRKGLAEREAAHALEEALERSVQNAPEYYQERIQAAREKIDNIQRERVEQGLPVSGPIVDEANAELNKWVDMRANANAKNQDNQTLLDRFRKARQTMAKSYDVEAVTNPSSGDVSATGLGRLLKKGRPLTGELKTIADAANNFHRAFQNPAAFGGVEPLSILDAVVGAGQMATAASTGSIPHFIAGALSLLRHPTRIAMMSDARQNAMIAPVQARTAPLSALTTPLLPTQRDGNTMAGIVGGQQ